MGFILRKFVLLLVLALAVSNPAMAKESPKSEKSQYKSTIVNINKANASALSAYLAGIGPVKAQAIVNYRRKNGKFTSAKDLLKVEGIGEATFDGLKKNISTSRGKAVAPEGYKMGDAKKSSSNKRKPASKRSKESTSASKSSSSKAKPKKSTSKKAKPSSKEKSKTTKAKKTTKKKIAKKKTTSSKDKKKSKKKEK